MAHFKLNEEDDSFLNVPQGAVLMASGADGAQTFLERDKDVTVRIVVASVAMATSDGATLEAVIDIEGAQAEGRAGPAANDTHLQVLQSVQVVLRPDKRLNFKAYPKASNARILKTVIYTADL